MELDWNLAFEGFTEGFDATQFDTQKEKSKAKSEGCKCGWCGEFSPYAEPNQPDNSFKCYGCRSTRKILKLFAK